MPRPGNNIDKSKDFIGSIKRLIRSLDTWKVLFVFALSLSMCSAILALIAPNKLSNLTDVITEGITPNTQVITEISDEIQNNIKFNVVLLEQNESLSLEQKQKIYDSLSNNKFNTLSDIELSYLLSNINYKGTNITVDDQIKLFKSINSSEIGVNALDKLPSSIYNLVVPSVNMDAVKSIAIFMAVLYIVSALFNYIQSFAMATISNKFAQALRTKISKKINKLPLRYFDTHETGDVLSRLTNDVDMIGHNLNQSLATLVSSLTLFLGSILMMFITNYIMAFTAILSTIFGFILMAILLKRSQKYFIMRQESLGELNGFIEEMYSNYNVVKVYNGTEDAKIEFDKLNNKMYEANIKSQFLSSLMRPIMGLVGNFGYVAVCIVGALLVNNGSANFGVIVAFMIYIRMFTNPLSQIAQAMGNLQSTAAASERVFEFLDEKEMDKQDNIIKYLKKDEVKGNIEFKHVKFGYDENRTIINDFSVKVKPGQKVAIVGPTGAGKTTMVNLLMKFYEINNGDIFIDGVSTKDLTRENIHELFCMVLQDTWLFDGTIKENLKFNKEKVSDEEIMNACKVVGIEHFIKTLPGGLNYQIGDNDAISSGQKQLFTIARGMIEDAPFLILDEATSNVDTRTEELVQKAMDKLTEGKTSFIIAHRLSTIKNADIILVMNEGNIVETGNHEELINKNGFYASLYNSQFEL